MTLQEIYSKSQDDLLNIFQTMKTLKEEIVLLNDKNEDLERQIKELTMEKVID